MEFEINGAKWIIEEVDEATINNEMKSDGTLGVTIYKTQKIMLLKDQANIIKTLKHELMYLSSEIWSKLYLKNGPLFQT